MPLTGGGLGGESGGCGAVVVAVKARSSQSEVISVGTRSVYASDDAPDVDDDDIASREDGREMG